MAGSNLKARAKRMRYAWLLINFVFNVGLQDKIQLENIFVTDFARRSRTVRFWD